MSKIKEWLDRQSYRLSDVFRKFCGTLILSFLFCAFWEYIAINDHEMNSTLEYIMIFLLMACVGVFFTECVLRGKKSREVAITGYIFAGLGAFLWVILDVISKSDISSITAYYMVVSAILYIVVLLGLSFIALIRDSGLTFEQYLLRITISLLRILLIIIVVNLGLLFVLWLFNTLITKFSYYDWIFNAEIILLAVVYIPYILSTLIDTTEPEQTRFSKGLVLYALMPTLISSTGIIYIYMIRILITREFPSNQIFLICAVLFCAGFEIWTMAYAYTRRNTTPIYNKIIRYMKYIYAPLIILEIYAITVRINECGWTMPRYFCIAFIIMQVIYIAWEPLVNLIRILRRAPKIHYAEHYEWMIYVLFGVLFFALIFPWSSASYIEYKSQVSRFDEVVNELRSMHEIDRNLTPDEYQQVAKLQYSGRSIRSVLNFNMYGKDYLRINYSDVDLDRMLSIDSNWWKTGISDEPEEIDPQNNPTIDTSEYYSGGLEEAAGLPISNFETMYQVSLYIAYDNPIDWVELTRLRLEYGQGKYVIIDLTDCISRMLAEAHQPEEATTEVTNFSDNTSMVEEKEHRSDDIFMIDMDGAKLLITQISFRYDTQVKMVYNVSMDGYLLLSKSE